MEAIKLNSSMEEKLAQEGAMMVVAAQEMTIMSDRDFDRGNRALKDIKARMKQVKDYWKGPKQAAQNAHKTLVARENEMLKPLEDAEDIIKKAMLDYRNAVRKARREAEQAALGAREAEEKRLLALAALAEKQGDTDGAEIMRDMAESVPVKPVDIAEPYASGMVIRKTWKARVINPERVPAYYDGRELRSINISALNSLARASCGKANVPGVEFYEDSTLSVRA